MQYNSKDSYFGNYEDGKRQGEGLFTYKNKDLYSGTWNNNLKHGKGTYVYFDTKAKYTGDWKDGKFISGKCTYTYQYIIEHKDLYKYLLIIFRDFK